MPMKGNQDAYEDDEPRCPGCGATVEEDCEPDCPSNWEPEGNNAGRHVVIPSSGPADADWPD